MSDNNKLTFEAIRHIADNGDEYWSARELAALLEYRNWRNFVSVMEKAKTACHNSANVVGDHFVEATNMIEMGKGNQRAVTDVHLSRYACYLIIQNADPGKPPVAAAQTYIAAQTYRQEARHWSTKLFVEMGSHELAANTFRASQTRQKIEREQIVGKPQANLAHYQVGRKVRRTIAELGGAMPEDLPTREKSMSWNWTPPATPWSMAPPAPAPLLARSS